MSTPAPPDQADRDAVRADLDRTLFVEAGAGTGKTTALVGRIVMLVRAGVPLREVAAITFTEAAAAELRDRVRTELQRAAIAGEIEPARADEVDDAAISTLHAFAQRIISEHPLEAGLPPAIEILDEIASGLEFGERWRRFVDDLYADASVRPVLLRAFALNLRFERLREVALRFEDQRDRLPVEVPEPPPLPPAPMTDLIAALRRSAAWQDTCLDQTDGLYERIGEEGQLADELAAAASDQKRVELLAVYEEVLRWAPGADGRKGPKGRKTSWSDECEGVRADHLAARERFESTIAAIREDVLRRLVDRVHQFTLDAAAERMADGRLAFHDLLIAARDLLRDHPEVRRAEHDHYRYVLIDEFQDTDPIQVELAILLATDVDDVTGSTWHQLPVDAGRLFFVGDPKQSIYRFRRADIDLFLDVQAKAADEVLRLVANFRSVPGVVDWVNGVFGELMPAEQKVGQAAYQALVAHRPAIDSVEHAVTVIGQEHDLKVREVRGIEATEIATVLQHAHGTWPVQAGPADERRPARWHDMAILLPTRTSLPMPEKALTHADVPYRVESASLVWSTQQIRELLAVLRAIDDPSDEVAVVAALRSPSLACSDDDLLAYRVAGGRWRPTRSVPESLDVDHPVVRGLALLRELHDERWWPGVSGLVEQVLRRLRFFELATAGPRPRDPWRRLRFVLQQAREFEVTPGATLRRFLDWADAQAAEAARVREPVLPESDDDAVRILTVHGAKGLEFPIVVLTGLNRGRDTRTSTVLWDDQHQAQVKISRFESSGFSEVSALAKELDQEERLRLLYVAATRARDHLVLSLHRPSRGVDTDARLIVDAMDTGAAPYGRLDAAALNIDDRDGDRGDRDDLGDDGSGTAVPLELPLPPPVEPPDQPGARATWLAERARLLGSNRRLVSRAATSLQTADDEKPEPQDEARPHRLGRAGSAVGRAVHATLQAVDLAIDPAASGAAVAAIAAAEAAAERVAELAPQVERAVQNALRSEVVREAVRHRYWREMYVGAPTEGGMIEGFIDLLYETPEGLVIVDYKTDRAPEPDGMEAAVTRYRLQLATYALALQQTLGRPVDRAALLFVSGPEARVRWIDDLPDAVDEVTALLAAPE